MEKQTQTQTTETEEIHTAKYSRDNWKAVYIPISTCEYLNNLYELLHKKKWEIIDKALRFYADKESNNFPQYKLMKDYLAMSQKALIEQRKSIEQLTNKVDMLTRALLSLKGDDD